MKKLLLLTLFFVVGIYVNAQIEKVIPARPNPPRLVNDYANLLTPEQQQALERKLVAYNDSTSNQVAIVIVESLNGYEANEYAVALGRKWGVGGSDYNNGVVILISTGGGDGNRDAYIATGYGLEGAIPDATANTIVDYDLIPNFKAGNYYRGLDEATDDIIKAAAGEYKAPEGYGNKKSGKGAGIIFFIIMIIIFSIIGSGRGRGGGGSGGLGAGWIIGSMLGGMSGRGGSGGGWSGGGGGGFGGFGGGSFGGGGAGGKW